MSNETIYLKGPFGTGIRYKGRTPFLSMLKLGSACLILGVAGISLYKYKKKIDIDEEIRKDKAVTQNKIDFDNVHTENNRQKKNTRGEIKKDVLLRQTREYSSNCQTESGVSQLSLHSWIEKFHSEYVMPDYSTIPILADVLAASPDGYQDAMMLHLLSAFGGICFSKVRAEFLDKKFHSPSLLTIIEGASGSGKGNFNTVYKVLFHRILESDRNKLKLEGCKQIIQTAGINVSASKFMDILAFNQGVHIYAMETELVKVYEAFSRKGGLEFSYLRNAFDNDEVYQNNTNFHVTASNMQSSMGMINTVLNVITIAVSGIAAISLIVGGVGVMNIMLVSITERTREIGVRMALGAKRRTIRMQFVIEAIMLCLIGGIIGILIGVGVGALLGQAAKFVIANMYSEYSNYIIMQVHPSATAILLSLFFSMLTGVFFGYYPANKASKMEVIDALRYE